MMRKGAEGERIAREFLEAHGWRTLETNYRYHHGEIDLIGTEGDVLVFCEVKTRFNDAFGPPEAAITPSKQAQIRKIAEAYLVTHQIRDRVCRFDVVAIDWSAPVPHIRHLKDAF